MGRAAAQRPGEDSLRRRTQPVHPVHQPVFGALPVSQSRWKVFLTIWSVQAITVLCLINLSPLFRSAFSAATERAQTVTSLVPFQPTVSHQQPVSPRLIVKSMPVEQRPAVARLTVT